MVDHSVNNHFTVSSIRASFSFDETNPKAALDFFSFCTTWATDICKISMWVCPTHQWLLIIFLEEKFLRDVTQTQVVLVLSLSSHLMKKLPVEHIPKVDCHVVPLQVKCVREWLATVPCDDHLLDPVERPAQTKKIPRTAIQLRSMHSLLGSFFGHLFTKPPYTLYHYFKNQHILVPHT